MWTQECFLPISFLFHWLSEGWLIPLHSVLAFCILNLGHLFHPTPENWPPLQPLDVSVSLKPQLRRISSPTLDLPIVLIDRSCKGGANQNLKLLGLLCEPEITPSDLPSVFVRSDHESFKALFHGFKFLLFCLPVLCRIHLVSHCHRAVTNTWEFYTIVPTSERRDLVGIRTLLRR